VSDLPEPLTPADCDLRGMPYMPLDIVRLFDSDFYALSTGEEFKAGLTLWGRAFLQVPAGSLPDDDRILAHLSGAGARWNKVRGTALRGWVKCSDGRLYHPTVAEKAAETWAKRQQHRDSLATARLALARKRSATSTVPEPAIVPDPVTVPDTEAETETVPATGLKGSVREEKGRDKERKEEEVSLRSTPAHAKRGARLDVGWAPSADDRALALAKGVDVDLAAEEFRNYWLARAGRDAAKLDWSRTFQNRLTELAERGRFPIGQPSLRMISGHGRPPSAMEARATNMQELQELSERATAARIARERVQ
jgi:Protein of unknown function (DUF1376)